MKNENRFYVYFHRLKETNEIFYIGKGTKHRATSKHGRSIPWNELVKSNEWYSEIHEDNLSEEDACILEVDLIARHNPAGNVQRKDISYREVDYRDFLSVYYYDETSPSGLRYVRGNRQSGHKKRIAGDPAGTLLKSGYYSVHYKYSNYFAHRVVWCLVNKCSIKKELIDHIDKNRSNNRIQNLRSVGTPENCKNIPIKSNNKTGYTGVSYLINFNIYLATWTDRQGVSYSKSFSALKHGNELALALAAEYRNRVATEDTGYLQGHDYLQPSILSNYSENQIQEMFDCDLSASNNSGISRVYFQSVRGNSFWNYSGGSKVYRFSCTKYGYDKARELAIEYKDFVEKEIDFQSLSADLKIEIDNPLSASNQTGFRNISFIGERRDKILVQVMIDYKNNTKTFNTRKLGLIPAIAAAEQWRDKMKNNTDGGYFGA